MITTIFMFDIALRHEYTPIINVTGNRDINTPHNTPETSASIHIERTSSPTTNTGRDNTR
jgi:hypothetical protein